MNDNLDKIGLLFVPAALSFDHSFTSHNVSLACDMVVTRVFFCLILCRCSKWSYEDIREVHKRRYLFQACILFVKQSV